MTPRRCRIRDVTGGLFVWCVVLTASLVSIAPARAQNPDSLMHAVRSRYSAVATGRARYVEVDGELDSLGAEHWRNGRGRFAAAFEGDTLRTLVATYGAHRDTVESYYFWRGAPVVVQVRFSAKAAGVAGTSRTPEQRFYFDRGYLVRWADPAHTIRPATTGAVFARAMHLLADATRLVDAARRERDQLQLPPSPAQVAESMRGELKAVMASERTYFAANNRYAGDLTAVNYQPRASVAFKNARMPTSRPGRRGSRPRRCRARAVWPTLATPTKSRVRRPIARIRTARARSPAISHSSGY